MRSGGPRGRLALAPGCASATRGLARCQLLYRLCLSLFDEDAPLQTEVEARFSEVDGSTALHFVARGLEPPQEIRALHEEWFRASEQKDLEATMFPIAADVLSYEHETPLVFRGAASVRASCELGFATTPPGLRWEVPDQRVIIRGDLAITWGLNHMHGGNVDLWSRGTRLFQRRDLPRRPRDRRSEYGSSRALKASKAKPVRRRGSKAKPSEAKPVRRRGQAGPPARPSAYRQPSQNEEGLDAKGRGQRPRPDRPTDLCGVRGARRATKTPGAAPPANALGRQDRDRFGCSYCPALTLAARS